MINLSCVQNLLMYTNITHFFLILWINSTVFVRFLIDRWDFVEHLSYNVAIILLTILSFNYYKYYIVYKFLLAYY